MARPMWFVKLLKKTFPNRAMIAKATRIPIVGRAVDKMLFEGDDIIYLPKESVAQKTIEINEQLSQPEDVLLPSEIVHHFIEKANHHWIMNFCICRDSSNCKDYPINYGCLFMGEAIEGINPKLGRRVTKEEAHEHVRKCRDAGLVHLIGRNKLDTAWLGVSPGDKLLTVCNCCPCCCLWRILPDLDPEIGRKVTKMQGVHVEVTDVCVGCGVCTDNVCFVNAISLTDEQATISDQCRGCGRCVEVCPENAIRMTIDNSLFVEDTIARISAAVDVE
jgi:ferredoxin